MNSPDREISDAFSLLGVLLVFVFAYGSALLPLIVGVLEQTTPVAQDDRSAFVGRLKSYHRLILALIVVALTVGGVLAPLTRHVLATWTFSGPFSTPKAGLLLVDALLLLTVAASITLERVLSKRIRHL